VRNMTLQKVARSEGTYIGYIAIANSCQQEGLAAQVANILCTLY